MTCIMTNVESNFVIKTLILQGPRYIFKLHFKYLNLRNPVIPLNSKVSKNEDKNPYLFNVSRQYYFKS